MNGKKNESIKISKKRWIFFNTGLILTLSFCITAFEWRFSSKEIPFDDEPETYIDSLFTAIKIEHPKPPAPKKPKPTHKPERIDKIILTLDTKPETKTEEIDKITG